MAEAYIIHQLYREYKIYSDFSVGGHWKEEHLFHIEAAFTWCLLYQKEHPKAKILHWQRVQFIFDIDNQIDLVDDETSSEDESASAEEMAEEPIDEIDTSGSPIHLETEGLERPGMKRRVMRDCTRQQFLKESADDGIPRSLPQNLTIGQVGHTEILDHIIKTAANEIKNFTELVKELKAERIKEILQEGLNPAIPPICQGGQFNIEA